MPNVVIYYVSGALAREPSMLEHSCAEVFHVGATTSPAAEVPHHCRLHCPLTQR